jgi:hypothetical protein
LLADPRAPHLIPFHDASRNAPSKDEVGNMIREGAERGDKFFERA